MSKEVVVTEIHRPARRNYKRRNVILKGINDLWQSDICVLSNLSRFNKGYKYILVVIDCFSKYLWTRALKTKSANDVKKAILDILSREKKLPQYFQSDHGTEYYNKQVKHIFDEYKIKHYSTFTIKKANFAERVIRTLKTRLYHSFHLRGTYRWIDILPEITDNYNKSRHRTIGMRPFDVFRGPKKIENLLLNTVYNEPKRLTNFPKFTVGDVVRISKLKTVFAKGYEANWSTELFKIARIKYTNPITYDITDMDGSEIRGAFYEQELQKTSQPDIYLVERILKRKNGKSLVKFLGLNSSHNTWINSRDMIG